MNQEPFERDLQATLQSQAPDSAPSSLRASVSVVTTSTPAGSGRGFGHGRARSFAGGLVGLAAVALGLGLVVAIVAYAIGAPSGGVGGGGGHAIDWDSGLVDLRADAVRIEAGGEVFQGPAAHDVTINSDPGDPTYRTLEVEWGQGGLPMRLYIYFAADKHDWWVSELRTYNGTAHGDWITYPGPMWKTPLGQPYQGDVDLSASERGIDGRLKITGMRLDAFAPDTQSKAFEGCRAAIEPSELDKGPMPIDMGPIKGVDAGMSAAQAATILDRQGICHTFRYSYMLDAQNGYGEIWCDPPPGKVGTLAYGSSGEVILFVEAPSGELHTPRPQPPLGWGC